jgi:hypothetical protein
MARRPNDTVQLKVRLSESLRSQIEAEARQHGFSMNEEILTRLYRSFEKDADSLEATARVLNAVLPPPVLKLMTTLHGLDAMLPEDPHDPHWRDWQKRRREISKAEAKVRALTDIPYHRALTLILNYVDSVQKKELPHLESFGPIIEMLIKDAEARGRKAEGAQEAEKAKTASSVLSLRRLKQANREGK